ncbi:MAG: hypothetical protein HOV81_03140 [Kofleriaceae bacterium]|nr:hypothetical protein [Kofleriaceae bacterium]
MSKFYAVGDRPVAVVTSPSGSTECLVFDFVSGNLIPDRSYLSEVSGESGRDVETLTQQEFARLVAEKRVEVLHMWAERLCRATSGAAEDLLTAIGAAMKPPPLGATETRVRGGEVGLANIELELPPNTVTKADLDETFGESTKLPRTGPGAPHILSYGIDDPGQPSRCTVFASFATTPEGTSSVKSVMLRLDRAR